MPTIAQRAWKMVNSGQARSFYDALSILGKHGRAVRAKHRRAAARMKRAQAMWWNRQ